MKLLNQYYPWEVINLKGIKFCFKGNVFFGDERLDSRKIFDLISPLLGEGTENRGKEIGELLEKLNGEFAIVAETADEILCAADKLRCIPLFYTRTEDSFIVSDTAHYLKEKINPQLNEENAAEFMVAGYVTGDETLFEGIKQIRGGEFLVYGKKTDFLEKSCYFRYLHGDFFECPESKLLEMLDRVFINVFERLIESTAGQGKQLVVPLSGGLDSRIIVAMLKRLGVNEVICFSYGRKSSREARISKQVAKALGYSYLFVEYTNKKWHACYHSKEANAYRVWGGNLTSLPHMQDFPALKELKALGKLPANSVFVPGHSGDMLAGSHIPRSYIDGSGRYDPEKFLGDNLKKHYILWKWPENQGIEKIFRQRINKSIPELEINDNETCANAIEIFDFNERQAKFIINSVRVYEFYGYGWKIPFWDSELIDFFLKVPVEHRINQDLYKKYARDRLFTGDLQVLKNIECTTDIVDLRPLKSRTNYKKIHYYNRYIHNYYNQVLRNPVWGRYFKNPLLARVMMKVGSYENEAVKDYPLLNTIIRYRNEKKYVTSLNGISALNYLSEIIEGSYSL